MTSGPNKSLLDVSNMYNEPTNSSPQPPCEPQKDMNEGPNLTTQLKKYNKQNEEKNLVLQGELRKLKAIKHLPPYYRFMHSRQKFERPMSSVAGKRLLSM